MRRREKTSSCSNERADTLLSMGLRQMHIAMYILCFTRGSAFRSSKGAGGWPNTTAAVSARRSSIMYSDTSTIDVVDRGGGEEYNY